MQIIIDLVRRKRKIFDAGKRIGSILEMLR